MAVNAMNAWHRRVPGESQFITDLVNKSEVLPMWGADNEDSKTPDLETFASACKNLMECFNKTISFEDAKTGKSYHLKENFLSKPIKRPPGLALPSCGHIYRENSYLFIYLIYVCISIIVGRIQKPSHFIYQN